MNENKDEKENVSGRWNVLLLLLSYIKLLCLRKFHQTWVCAVCLDFIDSSQPAVQLSSDSYSNAVKSWLALRNMWHHINPTKSHPLQNQRELSCQWAKQSKTLAENVCLCWTTMLKAQGILMPFPKSTINRTKLLDCTDNKDSSVFIMCFLFIRPAWEEGWGWL